MLQSFNVLRYELGQKYDSHYDAFNPSEYGPQQSQRVNFSIMTILFVCSPLSASCILLHVLIGRRPITIFIL